MFSRKSWPFLAILSILKNRFKALPLTFFLVIAIFTECKKFDEGLNSQLSLFKRATLIGKLSMWGKPLDQSASFF